ncbi:hypothetical protein BT69DRAFT_1337115 [Atractiella rhizophila]|nr:hypothetical protein BT69DRAFT_1337115 [Atractiella rhizophila]
MALIKSKWANNSLGMVEQQEHMATYLRSVPEVSTTFFLDKLTRSSSERVKAVMVDLKARGEIDANGCPARFAVHPKKKDGHEDTSFQDMGLTLTNIVAAGARVIRKEHHKTVTPLIKIVQKPRSAPTSDSNNTSKPDAEIHVTRTLEFKKKADEESQGDDYRKVVWGGNHILFNDCRREFAFGITIEDTLTRLWFFCRSHVVVSEEFEFDKHFQHLVHFMVVLAFPHVDSFGTINWQKGFQAIGFDINFTFEDNGKFLTFISTSPEFEGNQVHLKQEKVISDFSADEITGRVTRVFSFQVIAGHFNNHKNVSKIVLKDAWFTAGRNEVDAYKTIDELALKVAHDTTDPKALDFRKYFLTLLDYQLVSSTEHFIPSPNEITGQLSLLVRPKKQARGKSSQASKKSFSRSVGNPADLGTPIEPKLPQKLTSLFAREHYRLIFLEEAQPFYEIDNYNECVSVVKELTEVIVKLADLGYVHRDISYGNVLRSDGHLKLADLEFLCKVGECTDGLGTGTPYFQSVAVQAIPVPAPSVKLLTAPYSWRVKTEREEVRFTHFPSYDLESVWWLLYWWLLAHVPNNHIPPPVPSDEHCDWLRQRISRYNDIYHYSGSEFYLQRGILLFMKEPAFDPWFHGTVEAMDNLRLAIVHDRMLIEGGMEAEGEREENFASFAKFMKMVLDKLPVNLCMADGGRVDPQTTSLNVLEAKRPA